MTPRESEIRRWRRHIAPGERVLWLGRPRFGYRFDRTAARFALPAFAASIFILLGLPLSDVMFGGTGPVDPQIDTTLRWVALAALVWLAGYMLKHGTTPPFTRYALTDRRALIWRALPWPRLESKRLTPMTEIEWDGAEPGSIVFDTRLKSYGTQPGRLTLSSAPEITEIAQGFVRIEPAEKVFRLMELAKEGKA